MDNQEDNIRKPNWLKPNNYAEIKERIDKLDFISEADLIEEFLMSLN